MAWQFETQRLRARKWKLDDAELAWPIYSDPHVTRFIGGETAEDLASLAKRIEKIVRRNEQFPAGMGSFPVFRKDTMEMIGAAIIKPLPDTSEQLTDDIEIGWHLARRHWGNGFATEFAVKLLSIGFEDLQLDILHAVVDPPNQKSINVARRLGMTQIEDTDAYYQGQTIHHFVMTREEYFSNQRG